MGVASLFVSCSQEKMLFFPTTLPADYTFTFDQPFEERFIQVDEKTKLNGLLFKADSSKGLIFYLHGNSGALDSWGDLAKMYVKNNYDFFILDYRGYGKSQGKIESEKQLFSDVQIVYDSLKREYAEEKIVVIGYSIGTGPATHLSSTNKPGLLILLAPYYSMVDLAHQYIKLMPSFMIRYKLRTDEYITKVACPVLIFHGKQDEVIYYGSSLKLQELFKTGDRLVTLDPQYHNGMNLNPVYQQELSRVLQARN
ncbi:MAG: alpha/beta hydrolase [Cytophaga sp.]|uniref:alpha/beta hydrolase n=1 Tax=Cytophaga sp. TaxID=29535 RepID=UPI003F7DBF92